jgi:multicomponent Na+:H+ antiporter subunit B
MTTRRDGDEADGGSGTAPGLRPDGGSYETRTTVISRTVVRVVTPIILVTAISLLFQGHNLPGGGFIGAVLTVTAFVLVYVIFGLDYLQHDLLGLPLDMAERHGLVEWYRWMFALGLALAAGSGLVPLLFDLPFLTQAVFFLEHVPLYGEFEVASAFAFDLGVFFTVVGGLLTIVGEVGYE